MKTETRRPKQKCDVRTQEIENQTRDIVGNTVNRKSLNTPFNHTKIRKYDISYSDVTKKNTFQGQKSIFADILMI